MTGQAIFLLTMSPLAQWPPAASPAFDGLVPALSEHGAAPGAFGWYFHAKSSTEKNQPCNQLVRSSQNYKGCVLIARLMTSDCKRKVHVSLSSWWKRSWLVTNKKVGHKNKKNTDPYHRCRFCSSCSLCSCSCFAWSSASSFLRSFWALDKRNKEISQVSTFFQSFKLGKVPWNLQLSSQPLW